MVDPKWYKLLEKYRKQVTPEEYFEVCFKVYRNPTLPPEGSDPKKPNPERKEVAIKNIVIELGKLVIMKKMRK